MKRVRITLELDSTFIGLLNIEAQLGQWRERSAGEKGRTGLTPSLQLALVALMEARGGTEAEIWAAIQPPWRPHLDVVHAERKVEEIHA